MGSLASAQARPPSKATTTSNEQKLIDALVSSGAIKTGSGSVSLRDDATGQIREITVWDASTSDPQPQLFLRRSAPLEKAAYLGIASTPVPSALREQLALKKGAGVLVERVETDSPAQAAGIKQYDVIEKIDDQILVNAQQLAVLVRMHAAGEEIKLSIIRQGQKQVVGVKLTEKDLPPISEKNPWGLPDGAAMPGDVDVTLMSSKPGSTATMFKSLQTASPKQMRINILNEPYRIEYSEFNQQSQLKVTDNRSNALVYEGPVDTEEQRSLLPEQVKRSIGQLKPLRSSTQPGR